MNEKLIPGFTYTVELVRPDGVVIDREVTHNLMPEEGLNHVLNTVLKGGAQVSNWFVGLYEGNYTPVDGDTMAAFPAAATETTAYTSVTRVAWTGGTVDNGVVDNTAVRAEFTFSADKTVYGGFMSSVSSKGSGAGTLLSAVRFGSPKVVESGGILRVTAGFTMASA